MISCQTPVQWSWWVTFCGTSRQRSRCRTALSIAIAVCSTYATNSLPYSRRRRRPFQLLVQQHAAQDLAHQGLRQFLPELHLLGNLELGQMAPAVLQDLGGGGLLPLLQHDERLDLFSAHFLRDADDARILH